MAFSMVPGLWFLAIILACSEAYVHQNWSTPCACDSTSNESKVCGSDGRVHPSACMLQCTNTLQRTNTTVVPNANCKEMKVSLKVDCSCHYKVSPVCGTDGLTYKNLCFLRCTQAVKPSIRLYKRGRCMRRLKRYRRRSFRLRFG